MDAQGPRTAGEFRGTDGSKWQRAEERKPPARRLPLPALPTEDKRKKGAKNKPVAFRLSKKAPFPSETPSAREEQRRFPRRAAALKEAELAKALEEMEAARNLTELKRKALEELKQRSACLVETNRRLAEAIQLTDRSTAERARSLLQCYQELQRVKAVVQTHNQNRLRAARAELQEMEKTMEKDLGKLQQQLDEVTAKAQALQDELGALQGSVDTRCLEQAAQINLLQRSIPNLREQQQTELDKAEEMGQASLEELEQEVRAAQRAPLQKVVEELLLPQDGLKWMVMNNHVLRREILRQREIIRDLEEEIGDLKSSIQTLRQSTRDPGEPVSADVLLHRAKCTPDTEVVLSAPAEETPLI